MAITSQLGVIYMLHFHQPYRHARHYVGRTEDLFDRLDRHATGHGARLVAVIWEAGIGFTVIRICEGTRRTNVPARTRAARSATARPAPPTRATALVTADQRIPSPQLRQPHWKAVRHACQDQQPRRSGPR